ncbi:MAG: hypothetical protein ABR75_08130 [Acidimicrobiia bacterium BACL6 MAG-120924-bin43]|jgi:hypothetical protein|uniref:Cysteinyl-tRNA synthetase n=1 Tax=Acidimicrobiia bacterium BACL6 MAG-120924-bin43 TaxID=1655583 RepID=A0A0R2QFL0_9ACTN|nr:MAG: hypothetical protein ABR75_08130 [Acidimicrobiia bacterium BACL6 MAG-120924-bin43]KRO52668.1 MAG: hypothetical protein ABR78_08875 [Acidimicrobiia bacterium BACL6 MAG-120910-bin40]KRO57411.1 MAG: hypothetical protein ABR77_03940 [Acidimicrobiia bacterium BACL6 MAG-120322-bin79]
MTLPRILTIMGSGETAPTMVTTHRMLASKLPKPARATLLDTPYGFQENAPELATKAVEYFKTSINIALDVAGLTQIIDADALAVERGLQVVSDAQYVFAGPGSPTYALRQWAGTPLAGLLTKKLRDGGIVTFASAAALTLGRFTLPVYEIYKVGQDPRWLEGLNILGEIGINVALIPHYNNAEGGHHDTRFCYMGERRLSMLERELPDDVYVLGVDEHTGVVIDIDAQTATVVGKGVLTIRVKGVSTEIASGEVLPIDRLRNPLAGIKTGVPAVAASNAEASDTATKDVDVLDSNLRQATERLNDAFTQAITAGDADAAARAALDLDDAIAGWSIDTLQSDDASHARSVLRSMITRLAGAATGGLRDPREVAGPFVQVLLDLRVQVRADKRFDLSDMIRDRLAEINVEVRDTPQGAEWGFRN